MRLLLVEDDLTLQENLKLSLVSAGYSVLSIFKNDREGFPKSLRIDLTQL